MTNADDIVHTLEIHHIDVENKELDYTILHTKECPKVKGYDHFDCTVQYIVDGVGLQDALLDSEGNEIWKTLEVGKIYQIKSDKTYYPGEYGGKCEWDFWLVLIHTDTEVKR